jgi:N utilization substance protein B
MPKRRRLAREIALKTLYQVAIGGLDADEALAGALEANRPDPNDRQGQEAWPNLSKYAGRLVHGVVKRSDTYDDIIARFAKNWDPDRMPTVDRILMHIALEEMTQETGVPPGVAINEAVDIAKEYSTAESGRFINGVLAAWSRSEGPESGKENGED